MRPIAAEATRVAGVRSGTRRAERQWNELAVGGEAAACDGRSPDCAPTPHLTGGRDRGRTSRRLVRDDAVPFGNPRSKLYCAAVVARRRPSLPLPNAAAPTRGTATTASVIVKCRAARRCCEARAVGRGAADAAGGAIGPARRRARRRASAERASHVVSVAGSARSRWRRGSPAERRRVRGRRRAQGKSAKSRTIRSTSTGGGDLTNGGPSSASGPAPARTARALGSTRPGDQRRAAWESRGKGQHESRRRRARPGLSSTTPTSRRNVAPSRQVRGGRAGQLRPPHGKARDADASTPALRHRGRGGFARMQRLNARGTARSAR